MQPQDDDAIAAPEQGYWDLDWITTELRAAREDWRSGHLRNAEHGYGSFPSRFDLEKIMAALCGSLFPLRLGPSFVRQHNEEAYIAETLQTALSRLYGQIRLELGYSSADGVDTPVDDEAARIIGRFAHALPELRRLLDRDVDAAYAGDPAARSVDEVLLCYPCIKAIIHYRLANRLLTLGAPVVARIIAEVAHSMTGIDIHPGATIGHSFFIDHGSGVVIGETAIVGDRVRIYQAVTLGARSFAQTEDGQLVKGVARHPIVEDDVIIYAGATILGRVTIGRGSVIGGNVWLTEDVPPGSVIHQAYAKSEKPGGSAVPIGHVTPQSEPAGR